MAAFQCDKPARKTALILLVAQLWLPTLSLKLDTAAGTVPNNEEHKSCLRAEASDEMKKETAAQALSKLPLLFEEFQGRSGNTTRFIARGVNFEFGIKSTEAVLHLRAAKASAALAPVRCQRDGIRPAAPLDPGGRTASLRLQLVGANRRALVIGEDELSARSSYFLGNDPSRWRTGIANYAKRVDCIGYYSFVLVG